MEYKPKSHSSIYVLLTSDIVLYSNLRTYILLKLYTLVSSSSSFNCLAWLVMSVVLVRILSVRLPFIYCPNLQMELYTVLYHKIQIWNVTGIILMHNILDGIAVDFQYTQCSTPLGGMQRAEGWTERSDFHLYIVPISKHNYILFFITNHKAQIWKTHWYNLDAQYSCWHRCRFPAWSVVHFVWLSGS